MVRSALAGCLLAAVAAGCAMQGGARDGMSFFVASNQGKGADLGGLAGADARCQALAKEAGAGNRTWRAYLSTTAGDGRSAMDARDRIGRGPWRNAKGEVVAKNLEDLHGEPNINKQTALTHKGEVVKGRGDKPNEHDILTGSQPDGRAFSAERGDTTCSNWTSSGPGSAIVGHHDRIGLRDDAPSRSWNSSHPSRGCGQQDLMASGGAGHFYCFAVN